MAIAVNSANQNPRRLVLLDGLRGLAAVSVMLMHDAMAYGGTGLFARAYLSVDLFFLLSGFVLTLAFERKFAAGLGAGAFMRLRIARLWPVIAVGIALGAVMTLFTPLRAILGELLASNLVLLPLPPGQSLRYMLDAPAWSLACEFAVNLLHVLVLWRLSDRALRWLAVVAGLLLFGAILTFGLGDLGAGRDNWLGGYFRVLFAYPLGILIARNWRGSTSGRVPWPVGLLLPIAVIVALPLLPVPLATGDSLAMLVLLPLAFVLATRAMAPARAGPALAWLGAISYPVYAFNWPLIYLAVHGAADWPGEWQFAARIAALIATLGLAHLAVVAGRWRSDRSRTTRSAVALPSPA